MFRFSWHPESVFFHQRIFFSSSFHLPSAAVAIMAQRYTWHPNKMNWMGEKKKKTKRVVAGWSFISNLLPLGENFRFFSPCFSLARLLSTSVTARGLPRLIVCPFARPYACVCFCIVCQMAIFSTLHRIFAQQSRLRKRQTCMGLVLFFVCLF